MAGLRRASIRQRLRLIILLTSGLGLLAACSAFVLYDLSYQRQELLESHLTLARVLAENLASELTFDDRAAAGRSLEALRASDDVAAAAVYNASGHLVATYLSAEHPEAAPPTRPPPDQVGFSDDGLLIVRYIRQGDLRIGTIYLHAELSKLNAIARQHIIATIAVLLVCVLLTYALASLLQRVITVPLISLADTVREFATSQDTSIRAKKFADDELGALVDNFNELLGRIERDRELQARNDELKREKARIEAAARAKTEFLANMSHEIRTPMTAILGYIELLTDDGVADDERRIYNETIRRNGQHLLNIINDILDLSKIEAGKMRIERESCLLAEILDDLVALMSGRAREKGLEFSLEYKGKTPETIETDPTRLRQILINLVGNAVKFTSRGSVKLEVGLATRAPGEPPQIHFEVIDTGIGLRYDQIATIFDPFAQADNSTTREFGGTGLGLAISKRLAESLGGTVSVQSEEGRGSRFLVTIETGSLDDVALLDDRTDDLPQRKEALAEAPELGSGYVLLAEDGPDNQRLIKAFLTRGGFEVEVVGNGRMAVERALLADESGRPFDVILMDMHMPELDGYGATARLRRAGYERPIVALTAKAMKGNREECLSAGCDDYATKPIDRKRLLKLVTEYVKKVQSDS